ncbi:MAG: PEP-utilizing enzyme [Bryobacterales bacterium]|jgi:pyruvate,water dikinase|nr:PEP-utilizing enzyme [Bryobacterales bacterium]
MQRVLRVTGEADLPVGVGPKVRMIAMALKRGIPVPPFWLVPDEHLSNLQRQGLVIWQNGGLIAPDAPGLSAATLPKDAPAALAIRSAFSAEDAAHESLAGKFDSVLAVPADNADAVADALCRVWASASRLAQSPRRDVMLMRMVEAQHAGVAFVEKDYPFLDLVNFTRGLGDRMLGGQASAERIELERRGRWSLPGQALPAWQVRLQHLLRKVRCVFGDEDWDVEWADDGKVCWLLQVRAITRPTIRNDFFTMANHREILPDPPSWFMTSLVARCADSLFSYYRQFDARLPGQRRFIEVLHGRPLLNLSLLLDMMRMWGLPSRLVTDSIGGAGNHPGLPSFGFHPGRLLRSVPILVRQGLDQLRAPKRALRVAREFQAGGVPSGLVDSGPMANGDPVTQNRFQRLSLEASVVYTTLVREMFALTAAISGPLAILRRLGLLHVLGHGGRSHGAEMFRRLAMVAATVEQTPGAREQLQRGEFPDAEPFASAMDGWFKAFGTRGKYESDLSMPRFLEDAQSLIPVLLMPAPSSPSPPGGPWHAPLWRPLWRQADAAIQARESLRHHAMTRFHHLRQAILEAAYACQANGQLPTRDHIWMLSVEECLQLDIGWSPEQAFWRQRAQEQQDRVAVTVPDIMRRYQTQIQDASSAVSPLRAWTGIGLSRGTRTGRAWVLQEPAWRLPDGFQPESTILVARSIDAGWIPTFRLVAAVAVEIGGDLSHGSIILRELGVPAVTNLAGITATLRTGSLLRLQAEQGRVSRADEPTAMNP